MLIEIKPNNKNRESIVTSAFANKVEAGVQLVINTTNKWCEISSSYGESGGGKLRKTGYYISNSGDVNGEDWDEVIVIPEDKEEDALLDGLAYSLTNKDQVEILIVPWAKLKTLRKLCSTFDE